MITLRNEERMAPPPVCEICEKEIYWTEYASFPRTNSMENHLLKENHRIRILCELCVTDPKRDEKWIGSMLQGTYKQSNDPHITLYLDRYDTNEDKTRLSVKISNQDEECETEGLQEEELMKEIMTVTFNSTFNEAERKWQYTMTSTSSMNNHNGRNEVATITWQQTSIEWNNNAAKTTMAKIEWKNMHGEVTNTWEQHFRSPTQTAPEDILRKRYSEAKKDEYYNPFTEEPTIEELQTSTKGSEHQEEDKVLAARKTKEAFTRQETFISWQERAMIPAQELDEQTKEKLLQVICYDEWWARPVIIRVEDLSREYIMTIEANLSEPMEKIKQKIQDEIRQKLVNKGTNTKINDQDYKLHIAGTRNAQLSKLRVGDMSLNWRSPENRAQVEIYENPEMMIRVEWLNTVGYQTENRTKEVTNSVTHSNERNIPWSHEIMPTVGDEIKCKSEYVTITMKQRGERGNITIVHNRENWARQNRRNHRYIKIDLNQTWTILETTEIKEKGQTYHMAKVHIPELSSPVYVELLKIDIKGIWLTWTELSKRRVKTIQTITRGTSISQKTSAQKNTTQEKGMEMIMDVEGEKINVNINYNQIMVKEQTGLRERIKYIYSNEAKSAARHARKSEKAEHILETSAKWTTFEVEFSAENIEHRFKTIPNISREEVQDIIEYSRLRGQQQDICVSWLMQGHEAAVAYHMAQKYIQWKTSRNRMNNNDWEAHILDETKTEKEPNNWITFQQWNERKLKKIIDDDPDFIMAWLKRHINSSQTTYTENERNAFFESTDTEAPMSSEESETSTIYKEKLIRANTKKKMWDFNTKRTTKITNMAPRRNDLQNQEQTIEEKLHEFISKWIPINAVYWKGKSTAYVSCQTPEDIIELQEYCKLKQFKGRHLRVTPITAKMENQLRFETKATYTGKMICRNIKRAQENEQIEERTIRIEADVQQDAREYETKQHEHHIKEYLIGEITYQATLHTKAINRIKHTTIRKEENRVKYRNKEGEKKCILSLTFMSKSDAENARQNILCNQDEIRYKAGNLKVQSWDEYLKETIKENQNETKMEQAATEYFELWVPHEHQCHKCQLQLSLEDECRWRNNSLDENTDRPPKCRACR